MFITYRIFSQLQSTLDEPAARALTEIFTGLYEDLQNTVTKEDFRELKTAVGDLAEAQKRTEARMEELAEAQKRTEARMEELAEAQKRTEARVEELAGAQERTEASVDKLAEAQERTDHRLNKLTEVVQNLAIAQERTERSLNLLVKEHKETRKQLGGLSNTVGYQLEDMAYGSLPKLLARDHGIEVGERLFRRYIKDNRGRDIEVNIFGKAKKDARAVTVLGEAKSQLSKKNVDRFLKDKVSRLEGTVPEIFPVLVTYMISQPDVKEYAEKRGVAVYFSYDFDSPSR